MKRRSLIASFLLFVALCACAAYWAMQLVTPPPREVTAAPQAAVAAVNMDAVTALFGGRASAQVTSNFELKGVVVATRPPESVAILAESGKPARAVRVDAELAPGVVIKEVHEKYVLLSESGAIRRVDLPERAAVGGAPVAAPVRLAPPVPDQPPPQPAIGAPTNVPPPGAVAAQPRAGADAADSGPSGLPMRNRNVQRRMERSGSQAPLPPP